MKPVIALVGRPNVGKSTLFNRLTRSRDALVADIPGLTRDRHYGNGRLGDKPFLVVDTGGFEPQAAGGVEAEMARQAEQAIAEADVVVFLVDGRAGLAGREHAIADLLRKSGRRVLLAVNKTEGMALSGVTAEFYELGLGTPHAISSAHGDGVRELLELALAPFAAPDDAPDADATGRIRVAIAGRPNVGKSTLVNALLGEERVIAFDQPGTTRDAIAVDFDYHGRGYTLVDTAGLRRRGKVFETVEKFSVIKTMQAIADAHVVVLMLDARADISLQDAHIAGFILDSGRALVVAVNKWDGLDGYTRERVKQEFARKLAFLSFANLHYISAREGQGIAALMRSVGAAYGAATIKLATPRITRALLDAVARQQPPRAGAVRPKLRYAHQGGSNPPIIVVHGNSLSSVPEAYRRYLEGYFRETFRLKGTPLKVQFKEGRNPFATA
ncbi:MAG: ribosome biogenesis GTPase Der [Burkholderiales bacterium]|nr:ribosome biogenesis GTPase Der [Burkholderiales bacterium]